MPPRWSSGLVAIASRVVPRGDRERWRQKWDSDLDSLWTLIERGEMALEGRALLARFCLSAFGGAFWLRFNREGLRQWTRTAGFLPAAGTAALLLGGVLTRGYAKTRFLIDMARHWQPSPPKGLSYDQRGDVLVAYGFPIVLAATTAIILIAIGCRMLHRGGWRYWCFFVLKTLLLLTIGAEAWIEGGAALRSVIPNQGLRLMCGGLVLAIVFVGVSGWCALWTLADQRRRCPVCLRRLEMPVTLGSWSSVFEPATTEFLCSEGHGSLSLLEAEPAADRWVALDASWRGLFRGKSDKNRKDPILR